MAYAIEAFSQVKNKLNITAQFHSHKLPPGSKHLLCRPIY